MPKSREIQQSKPKHIAKSAVLNAVTVKRSENTVEIPIDKIKTPEWMADIDRIFGSLYKKYLTGRIPGFLTRVPMNMIREGFYVPSRKFEYRCATPPEEIVRGEMVRIQQGVRKPLYLYSNPNPNDEVRFLCPDCVVTCMAYRRLRIDPVPAIVLAPGSWSLPFSSIKSKAYLKAIDEGPRMCGVVSTEKLTVHPLIIGNEINNDPISIMNRLSNAVTALASRLRLFHAPHPEQLHYHHMVFSAVIRMQKTLQAIEVLIAENLWYQVLALLRVLYEIHLNFYFDWLQPQINYRFLAAAAVFNFSDIANEKRLMIKELVSKGVTLRVAKERVNNIWKPVIFSSTVSEKAKLPKVGILFHNDIYDFLSQVSHQNFEVAALHANWFDNAKFLEIETDMKITYLSYMDYIVSEFVLCVEGDIGLPEIGIQN